MENRDLRSKYDRIYENDAYERFFTFSAFPQWKLIIEMMESWAGLDVLEIGCGEGRLAAMMSIAGAKRVDAIDYSTSAIEIARNTFHLMNVSFHCKDYRDIEGQYDVVVLDGVLEHLDRPFDALNGIMKNNLKCGGTVICQCPSFINPRGYVWMTLQLLFDVPMSLTDIHFLCPFDFEDFCSTNGYELQLRSAHQNWGAGERMIIDFNKRLRMALKDAGQDNTGVDRLLDWLSKASRYHQTDEFSGAVVVYKIRRN